MVRGSQRAPALEICAIPAERLIAEREVLRPLPSTRPEVLEGGTARKVDKLATVRFGSARYSVPHRLVGTNVLVAIVDGRVLVRTPTTARLAGELVAEHRLVGPGEVSLIDEHYDRPRGKPVRAVRPKSTRRPSSSSLGRRRRRSCARQQRPRPRASQRTSRRSSPWSPRTARPPSSQRSRERPRSIGSPPRTSGRSWPPARRHPRSPHTRPGARARPARVTVRSLEDYRIDPSVGLAAGSAATTGLVAA